MNRKLHNSMLAFSATGLTLVFALMAASPVSPGPAAPTAVALAGSLAATDLPAEVDADALVRLDAAERDARDIEALARQLGDELENSSSLGETIASAVSFAAAISTETALNAAFEATADRVDEKRDAAREKRRHARQVRGTLAVPYFSFAQGLRRGSRS